MNKLLRVDKMLTGLIRSLQKRDKDNQSKKKRSYPNALRLTVRVKKGALRRAGI